MKIVYRSDFDRQLDEDELGRIQEAVRIFGLEKVTAIDSYSMTESGPSISSAFLLDSEYLVEVSLTGKDRKFDIVRTTSFLNYHVKFSEHVAVVPKQQPDSEPSASSEDLSAPVQFVQITLFHNTHLTSTLSYFGKDILGWVDFVLRSFPRGRLR